jgi:beta-glucanase (GH16 family)
MALDISRRSFLLSSAQFGLGLAASSRAMATEADPVSGRTLTFADNFGHIDWTVWDAGPKPTKSDPGFYGRSAFARRDGEEGFNPYAIVDDAAATDGKALQISAKYIGRTMSVPHYYGNTFREFQWISGNLKTAKRSGEISKSWRKGYFEARMLFPRHPLTWPAFWMMNGRSILFPKTSIELDVVEHKGWEPNLYGAYLHEWGEPGQNHDSTGVPTPVDMTRQYCRYGILVTDEFCTPYFERVPVIDMATKLPAKWKITRARELDMQGDTFWPLLTLALRSDVPYPAQLRPEELLTHMRIDYFHVYQ